MTNFTLPRKLHLAIIVLTFILAAFQQSYRIGFEQIKIWDEASGARNAVEMLTSNSYVVVLYNGKPDYVDTKPPLAVWLKVISYKLFGINEFSVRLTTILASWLSMLLLVFFALRYLKSPAIAWILLFLVATTQGYMTGHVARHGDPDALLAFFVAGYIIIYFIILEKGADSKTWYFILLGLFIVGAVYTKSIAGLVPLLGLAIYTLAFRKGWLILKDVRMYITAFVCMIVIVSYYIIRSKLDPGYLKAVMSMELGLFTSYPSAPKHPEATYYFNYLLKIGFRPHFFYIPLLLVPLIFSKNSTHKRLIIYSFIGALSFLVIHSSAVTKNQWYISPIYPFLWLLLAVTFYETFILIGNLNLKKKWIIPSLQFMLVFMVIYFGADRYRNIFKSNYIKPGGYIYEPERIGHYFKDLKTRHPEYKNLTALTTKGFRQIEFYAKKYNYEDSTCLELIDEIKPDLLGKKVLITDTIDKKMLNAVYSIILIDSAKYGRLYQIEAIKDSSLFYYH